MERSIIEKEKIETSLDKLRDYLKSWLKDIFIRNEDDFHKYVMENKKIESRGQKSLKELDIQGLLHVFMANQKTLTEALGEYGIDSQLLGYAHAINAIRNKISHKASTNLPLGRFNHDIATINLFRTELENIKKRFYTKKVLTKKNDECFDPSKGVLYNAFVKAMLNEDLEYFNVLFSDKSIRRDPEFILDNEGTSIWMLWNHICYKYGYLPEQISSSEITRRLKEMRVDEYELLLSLYQRGGCKLLEKVAKSDLKINARSASGLRILDEVFRNENNNKIEKITSLRNLGYRFGFNPFDPLPFLINYYNKHLLKEHLLDCLELGVSKDWGARLMIDLPDEEARLEFQLVKQKEIPNKNIYTSSDSLSITRFVTLEDMLNNVPMSTDTEISITLEDPC